MLAGDACTLVLMTTVRPFVAYDVRLGSDLSAVAASRQSVSWFSCLDCHGFHVDNG